MTDPDRVQVLAKLCGMGLATCMGVITLTHSLDLRGLIEKKLRVTNTMYLLIDIIPTLWITALYYGVGEIFIFMYLSWSYTIIYNLIYFVLLVGTLITFSVVGYFAIRLWYLR